MSDSNIYHINMNSFPKSHLYPDKRISLSITKSGTYILDEDIIAGSRYTGDDETVLDFGRQVGPPPFHFGIWSILSIECDDVILDLNGYKLAMTDNFAMEQRFFSLIELANQPFPTNTAGFTSEIKFANNLIIKNGTLDNSSHHGIHGNFNTNVLIDNVTVINFEIAGIAINGGKQIIIQNSKVIGASKKITVLATFAMIQDFKNSLETILSSNKYEEYHKLATKYLSNSFIQHILDNPGSDDYNITVNNTQENGDQVLDGNLFGIYFSNNFNVHHLSNSSNEKTTDITIDNVKIKDISSDIKEVIGISVNDKLLSDNKGYLLRWDYLFDDSNKLKLISESNRIDLCKLTILKTQLFVTKILTPEKLLNTTLLDYIDIYDIDKVFSDKQQLLTNVDLNIYGLGGVDARGHLAKGNFGLRIDGASNVNINNVHIHNIQNYGQLGIKTEKTVYSRFPIGIDNNSEKVYKGTCVSGMSLSNCDNINVNKLNICKCNSSNGYVIGIGLLNNTYNCVIKDVSLNKLTAGLDNITYKNEYPNLKPVVYNGYIDPTSYYNKIHLSDKCEITDADKDNKLTYNCGKCDKVHKLC